MVFKSTNPARRPIFSERKSSDTGNYRSSHWVRNSVTSKTTPVLPVRRAFVYRSSQSRMTSETASCDVRGDYFRFRTTLDKTENFSPSQCLSLTTWTCINKTKKKPVPSGPFPPPTRSLRPTAITWDRFLLYCCLEENKTRWHDNTAPSSLPMQRIVNNRLFYCAHGIVVVVW